MKINVIGTGEAFNQDLTNSSFYIQDKLNILIDCGFRVPYSFWKNFNGNNIDLIYITHFHGDHFFGLPALIARMIEEKRNKEIVILGQNNIEEMFNNTINLAYPNILSKKEFKISFFKHYELQSYNNLSFTYAKTNHSVLNYSICIKNEKASVAISGDGAPTSDLINMYNITKPNIIIQECFTKKKHSSVHCSLEEIMIFEKELNFKTNLYLTHISRSEIKNFKKTKYIILQDSETLNL